VVIGKFAGVASYWTGVTSDPILWSNRILSPGEIQTLADRSDPLLDGLIVGTASRSRVYFPSAAPSSIIPRIMRHRKMLGVS
jgi:hypothetical protein